MKHELIRGKGGRPIPCEYEIKGDEKLVILVVHGLGSSKESDIALRLYQSFPAAGVGVCSFDYPGHGNSPSDDYLVKNCLSDLADVDAYVRKLAPHAEVAYFGSSFGVYSSLLYLKDKIAEDRKEGRDVTYRVFSRSGAVSMPDLMEKSTADQTDALQKDGWFWLNWGFARSVKITAEYLQELKENDLFQIYAAGEDSLAKNLHMVMVHGEADDLIPVEGALDFAELVDADITVVPGGDHRLSIPGGPQLVVEKAKNFFEIRATQKQKTVV
ncbi:MAG: alpha/beta hydrolase [Clostridiales bacterium]|nr:alpha/beta hydrolase [Clostridiales bacterium]